MARRKIPNLNVRLGFGANINTLHENPQVQELIYNNLVSGIKDANTSKKNEATIDTNISSLLTSTELANWNLKAGNSTEYTYYTGIDTGNPSGSTSNVKLIVYKEGISTILTQTISYNASDLVISIVTT